MDKRVITWAVLALCLATATLVSPAYAQAVDPAQEYSGIIDTFYNTGGQISSSLMGFAKTVFVMLFLLQLSWGIAGTIFKGNTDLGDLLQLFITQAMYFGFFYALLMNSYEWGNAIVNSFRMAGAKAVTSIGGVGAFAPVDVFLTGFDMAASLLKEMSIWPTNYAANLVILLCTVGLIMMCAYISVLISKTIIESHIVIGAATLLMGFGGGSWTKDIAISTLRFTFSIGAKLFIMQLIVGVAFAPLKVWAKKIGGINVIDNLYALFVIVGLVFFVCLLVKHIPDMIQAMINGTASPSTGAGSVAGIAAGAAGAALAVGAAGRLASAQSSPGPAMQSLSGQNSTVGATMLGNQAMGMIGHGASFAAALGSNLLKAGMDDLGGRLTGKRHFGTMGGRMAEAMNEEGMAVFTRPEPPQAAHTGGEATSTALPAGSISGGAADATAHSATEDSVAAANADGQQPVAPTDTSPGGAPSVASEHGIGSAASATASMQPEGPSTEPDRRKDSRLSSLGGALAASAQNAAAQPASEAGASRGPAPAASADQTELASTASVAGPAASTSPSTFTANDYVAAARATTAYSADATSPQASNDHTEATRSGPRMSPSLVQPRTPTPSPAEAPTRAAQPEDSPSGARVLDGPEQP